MSPLAAYPSWVIFVACRLDSFIESLTSAVNVVNALFIAVSVQNPKETIDALKNREAMWKDKNIYIVE